MGDVHRVGLRCHLDIYLLVKIFGFDLGVRWLVDLTILVELGNINRCNPSVLKSLDDGIYISNGFFLAIGKFQSQWR